MTLHGELIQNMLEPLANHCRAECRHEWISPQVCAGSLVEKTMTTEAAKNNKAMEAYFGRIYG